MHERGMTMKNTIIRALTFFLCMTPVIFAAIPVNAIDLTLNIPVELVNMPESVTGGSIRCSAHGANRVSNVQYGSQPLGTGDARFDIKGTYRSTARVIIKNDQPNPPNGIGYKCTLFLFDGSQRKDSAGWLYAGTVLGRYAIDTSKPTRYDVSGIR